MIRQELDARGIFPFLPDGYKVYVRPELPKITFSYDKVRYSVTDLRFLNTNAIYAIVYIIEQIRNNGDIKEVTCKYPQDMSDEELEVISTVAMGITYNATKTGKKGFSMNGTFLVEGYEKRGKTLTFHLFSDHVKVIYEYLQNAKESRIYDLIIELVNKEKEDFSLLDNLAENGNNNITNG